MKRLFPLFAIASLSFIGCNNNDDDVMVVEEQEAQEEVIKNLLADYPVQDFMWSTMNLYYFFLDSVDDLSDGKRTSPEDQKYIDFLAEHPNPEDFFFNTLLAPEDRFSFLSDDYRDLVNSFLGVSKSNGVEFGLTRYGNGEDVLGYVEYILPNSDASGKNIERGDIFIGVNGTNLNLSNYRDLLFGDNDTYTLNLATIENNTLTPNNQEVTLTKQEGLVEEPIFIDTVLDFGGSKIGYLMYNQFTFDSGEALNEVFGNFKNEGITDLVLDLRYNPGGSGFVTSILASLIYGTNTSQLFYKVRYNSKLEEVFDPSDTENFFLETTGSFNGNSNTPLNTLNLSKIYVLTTQATASASELLINGLEPYMDVVQIGTLTTGKNEGSFTFVDDPENGNFYDAEREDNINPNNQWAIQPIVSRVENADGFGEYSNGLSPDIEFTEDLQNLGVLGTATEPFLARAIEIITNVTAKSQHHAKSPVDFITSSSLMTPFKGKLHLNTPTTSSFSREKDNY